jgi:hypothetical protein
VFTSWIIIRDQDKMAETDGTEIEVVQAQEEIGGIASVIPSPSIPIVE